MTDHVQPIVYGGDTFAPAPLKVDGVSADSSDVASSSGGLSIGAGDDYWPTLLAALAEDERHPEVVLYEAWFAVPPVSATPAAVRTVATFLLESAEVTTQEARLTLAPLSDGTLGRLPFREYGGALCTYRVAGGPQCGAAAAAAGCARTWTACGVFANQARFGGCRELPGEEVSITWRWWQGANLIEKTLTLRRRAV
ncbi:MAG: hypothetical protein WC969_14810 [Elusimicrobiota bacterium]